MGVIQMAQTYYRLMEKDFDTEMANDWKWVEDAPRFDTITDAAEWLEGKGVKYLDQYRAVANWME
jgi:hypothetical protein